MCCLSKKRGYKLILATLTFNGELCDTNREIVAECTQTCPELVLVWEKWISSTFKNFQLLCE